MFWFAFLHTLRAFAVRSLEIETFPVKLERIVSNYVEVFSSCRFMTANDPSHSFPTHLKSRSREAQNIPTQLTSSDHRLVSQNCVRPSIVIRFRLSAVLLCLVLRSELHSKWLCHGKNGCAAMLHHQLHGDVGVVLFAWVSSGLRTRSDK